MASSPLVLDDYEPRSSTIDAGFCRGRLRVQLLAWLPVLAFSMVFAVESTSCFGADRTSAPMQRIAEAIFGYGVGLHWELIHQLIRKTGHFMGYGVFSLVCFRAFWIELRGASSRLRRQLRAHGLAILATFLVASADEIHQCFLPNRYGQFSDVLIDTCGGVALGLVVFLAMRVAEGRRQTRRAANFRCEPDGARAVA
jgi:VanZ family protein